MMHRSFVLLFSIFDIRNIQIAWLISALFIVSGCNLKKPVQESSVDDFSSYLNERIPVLMERYEIPGVSVVLVQNGERVWGDAYGSADLSTGRRMTTDTVCRVESISKSVTTWGVMKLAEEGKIDLDEPVHHYLKSWSFPESPFDETKITLRQLLSHHSGLPLGPIGEEYDPDEEKPTLKESLSRNAVLIQEPGSKFTYSNVGFHLIELLIEEITGRDFADYMKDEVLNPLQMNQASYDWSELFDPPVPLGYDLHGNAVPVYVYPEKGSGGLFASAEDIALFMVAGMKSKGSGSLLLLSQHRIEQMVEPAVNVSGIYSFVSESYGFGHFIDSLSSGDVSVFSGGQGHGWMTHFQSIPQTGDGIVILTNSQRSWPFIGYILKDWAEWRGYSSIGMGRIVVAVNGIWFLIGFLFLGSIYQGWRLGHQIVLKQRRFEPLSKQHVPVRLLQLILSLCMIVAIFWSINQDYFFLFSVFPVASTWLIYAILFTAVILLSSVFFFQKND